MSRTAIAARLTRCVVFLASVALQSCTLTADDFEPALATTSLEPSVGGSGAGVPVPSAAAEQMPTSGVGAECEDGTQCQAGSTCQAGVCVPTSCLGAEDQSACAIAACLDGDCASDECSDGARGAAETDVDCGGACGPCALGGACVVASDCENGLCVAGACAAATCTDRVDNQDESGVDCGGASCPRCAAGQRCGVDADCSEGLFCPPSSGLCSPTSCQDGARNGAELAIDCGGGACPGCGVGGPCSVGTDCSTSSCGTGGTCAAPSCTDGVRNADESDTDCGGSCPVACAAGRACAEAGDCASAVCGAVSCGAGVAQCCQAPTCGDGVANGGEPGVDCGNARCGLCDIGRRCTANAECQSGLCGSSGTCEVLLVCGNGQLDGNESAQDCGGTEAGCPRCEDAQTCRVGADCASGRCAASGCVSCRDGVQNGDEAGLDCGSSSEPSCPACPRCNEQNSVDLSGVGFLTTLPANGCAKITDFPYAPTLVDSFEFGPFPVPFSWTQVCTGQSGSSSFNGPYERRNLTGLSTACPVLFDLAGSSEPIQIRWW